MIHVCVAAGGGCTWGFTKSMVKLTDYMQRKHIQWRLFGEANSDIYVARNYTLYPQDPVRFGDPPKDMAKRLPFNGKLDYDFIIWIDTDMVFEPEQVMKLVENDVDICSGLAMISRDEVACGYYGKTKDGDYYFSQLALRRMDPEKLVVESTFESWLKDKQRANGLCVVDYAGCAFLCVKRGVYEAMQYPWYRSTVIDDHGPTPIEASEDIGWCWRARKLGYEIFVDPSVQVGHEKRVELRAF